MKFNLTIALTIIAAIWFMDQGNAAKASNIKPATHHHYDKPGFENLIAAIAEPDNYIMLPQRNFLTGKKGLKLGEDYAGN